MDPERAAHTRRQQEYDNQSCAIEDTRLRASDALFTGVPAGRQPMDPFGPRLRATSKLRLAGEEKPGTHSTFRSVERDNTCPLVVVVRKGDGQLSGECYPFPTQALQEGWRLGDIRGTIFDLDRAHRPSLILPRGFRREEELSEFLIGDDDLVQSVTRLLSVVKQDENSLLGTLGIDHDARRRVSRLEDLVDFSHKYRDRIFERFARTRRVQPGSRWNAYPGGKHAANFADRKTAALCADCVADYIDSRLEELRNRPLLCAGSPLATQRLHGSKFGSHPMRVSAGKRMSASLDCTYIARMLCGVLGCVVARCAPGHSAALVVNAAEKIAEADDQTATAKRLDTKAAKAELTADKASKKLRAFTEARCTWEQSGRSPVVRKVDVKVIVDAAFASAKVAEAAGEGRGEWGTVSGKIRPVLNQTPHGLMSFEEICSALLRQSDSDRTHAVPRTSVWYVLRNDDGFYQETDARGYVAYGLVTWGDVRANLRQAWLARIEESEADEQRRRTDILRDLAQEGVRDVCQIVAATVLGLQQDTYIPMSAAEIVRASPKKSLEVTAKTIYASLCLDVTQNQETSLFFKTVGGLFGLQKWNDRDDITALYDRRYLDHLRAVVSQLAEIASDLREEARGAAQLASDRRTSAGVSIDAARNACGRDDIASRLKSCLVLGPAISDTTAAVLEQPAAGPAPEEAATEPPGVDRGGATAGAAADAPEQPASGPAPEEDVAHFLDQLQAGASSTGVAASEEVKIAATALLSRVAPHGPFAERPLMEVTKRAEIAATEFLQRVDQGAAATEQHQTRGTATRMEEDTATPATESFPAVAPVGTNPGIPIGPAPLGAVPQSFWRQQSERKRAYDILTMETSKDEALAHVRWFLEVIEVVRCLLPPAFAVPEALSASGTEPGSGLESSGCPTDTAATAPTAGGTAVAPQPTTEVCLATLLLRFWPRFTEVINRLQTRVNDLSSLMLYGRTMDICAELHGSPRIGGTTTGLGLHLLERDANATSVSELEATNEELRKTLKSVLSRFDRRNWNDNEYDKLVQGTEPVSVHGRTVVIHNYDHLAKLAKALELFLDPQSIVRRLESDENASEVIRGAVAAVVAAVGTGVDNREPGPIINQLNDGSRHVHEMGASVDREHFVTELVNRTSALHPRCRLLRQNLSLIERAPAALTKKLFIHFLSSALSKQLLYEFSRHSANGTEPQLDKGISLETLKSILSLAPLDVQDPFDQPDEDTIPLALVTLRTAMVNASDVVGWIDTDDAAKRLVRVLFPWGTSAFRDDSELEAEFKALWTAVRCTGRLILSAPVHGRCADDPGAWDALFPPFYSAPDDPADYQLRTWFARRVALAASETPITLIQSLWTVRSRVLLVLPEGKRLRLSSSTAVKPADAATAAAAGASTSAAAQQSASASASTAAGGPWKKLRVSSSAAVKPSDASTAAVPLPSAAASASSAAAPAVATTAATAAVNPAVTLCTGSRLLWSEKERIKEKRFSDAEVSPDRAFHSTKAAPSLGDKTAIVGRSVTDITGGADHHGDNPRQNVPPWRGPGNCRNGKVSAFYLDEAIAVPQRTGWRTCHSWPTSHRAGGNGQVTYISDEAPMIAAEVCSVLAHYGTKVSDQGGSGLSLGDYRVACCHLAALPCFQVMQTLSYVREDDVGPTEWERCVESDPQKGQQVRDAKLPVVSVDIHGCVPCGRAAGSLHRRLVALTLLCLGRNLGDSVDLSAVADWNTDALDPFDQCKMLFQFFELLYAAKPSLKDFMLKFLRGFAGYGGAPGRTRSIDGRYLFSIKDGAVSPRLDVDAVFHEPNHGHVEHLPSSDHGALRWSILPAAVSSGTTEETETSLATGGGGDLGGDHAPVDVQGSVWQQLAPVAGMRSLSGETLSEKDKAILGLCFARSRSHQFKRRGRLDFLGSDVFEVRFQNWGETLRSREVHALWRLFLADRTAFTPDSLWTEQFRMANAESEEESTAMEGGAAPGAAAPQTGGAPVDEGTEIEGDDGGDLEPEDEEDKGGVDGEWEHDLGPEEEYDEELLEGEGLGDWGPGLD